MKQLINETEFIGKTISKVIIPKDSYQNMWIAFTDKSFAVFDISNISTGFNTEDAITLSTYVSDNTNKELVELGLITKEQYELAIAEDEEKYKQHSIKRAAEDALIKEQYEKKQLAKLKEKYE